MNTLFIIYTFVSLVCLFQIIILTCEATRHKHQIDALSNELDLYKRLVDSINDGQAQLNSRVQQLEMLNSNGGTLTDKYNPLNPSGVMYDTSVIQPETITFEED